MMRWLGLGLNQCLMAISPTQPLRPHCNALEANEDYVLLFGELLVLLVLLPLQLRYYS